MVAPLRTGRAVQRYRGAAPVLWTPLNLGSALPIFFDPSTSLTVASSKATSWKDRVSGLALTQATSSKQPAYSATGLGGKPALTFTGTQSLAAAAATGLPAGSAAASTFIAYKGTTASGSNEIAFSWGTGDVQSERLLGYQNNGPYPWYVGLGQSDPHGPNSIAGTASVVIGTDTGGDQSTLTIYQDGTQGDQVTAQSAMATVLSGGVRVGLSANAYCNPFLGTIGMIGVVNRVLTTSERQKLEGYLAWYYGLQGNLPASHPYKSRAPYVSDP